MLKGCVIRLEIMKHKISVDPTERKIITIKLILKEFNDNQAVIDMLGGSSNQIE